MHTRSTFSSVLSQLFAEHSHMVAVAENHEAQFDAADELRDLFNNAGHTAQVKAETDEDGVTVVIFTAMDPAHVISFLGQGGIPGVLIDFFDNDDATTGTYSVRFHGVDLALVAQRGKVPMKEAA